MSSWLKAAEEFLDGSEQHPPSPSGGEPPNSFDLDGSRGAARPRLAFGDNLTTPPKSRELQGSRTVLEDGVSSQGKKLESRRAMKSLAAADGIFGAQRESSGVEPKHEVEKAIKEMQSRQGEGNPREARLQQVCEQLREQLAGLKNENSKLEGRLRDANSRAKEGIGQVESLEKELHDLDASSSRREATLQAEVVAKDMEINKINSDMETSKKWGSELEAQVAALKETNQKLLEDHQADQGRMMEALRDQLSDAERQLEQQRGENARMGKSAEVREAELQQELTESAGALAKMQRQLDDRNSRVNDLEARVSSLVGELHRAHAPVSASVSAPDRSFEIDSLEQQLLAASTKVEEAMRCAQEAENRSSQFADEVEVLRQQVSSSATQASSNQLEDRLKEVTELLYQKQTQYERLASDKASQHLTMERQLQLAQDQISALKTRVESANRSQASGTDTVIPMDSLGEAFHNLANHKRVGRAVRTGALFVDNTASKLVFLLRQHPLWRVGVFLYFVFIHLYCYLLISRMQRQAVVSYEKPHTGGP